MKHISLGLLSLVYVLFALPLRLDAQSPDNLGQVVDQVQRELQGANLSVCLYDITHSRPVFAHNATAAMPPASLAKLFTIGAGFERLHPDFRFSTRLGIGGSIDRDGTLHGNVYLIGGGDPLLGSYRYRQTTPDSLFSSWLSALRKRGIRRIDGRVCYNSTVFDDQPLHNSWMWGDIGNYYASGVYGLNFHENMYFVYFNPGKRQGHPASVSRTDPKNLNVQGVCEVSTGAEGSGDNVTIYGAPNSTDRLYRGTVPLGKPDFRVRGSMPSPPRSCADLFSTHLRTHGIGLSSSSMEVFSVPDTVRIILDYKSSDYYTIAQYTNLTSNNLYAEAIFKYLGFQHFGKGSFENGAKVVTDFLRQKGLDPAPTHIVDGSGLSLQNHTTADFLCRYLAMMTRQPYSDYFLHTLPVAGESGTARNLLPGLPKGVKVWVKTGTQTGIKTYAGYITTPDGVTYAFAIMADRFDCPSATAADKLTRILRRMVDSL